MTLLSEGAYPAGGALLIGPDSTLNEVGLASGDTLMVQVQSPKKPAPKRKTTPRAAWRIVRGTGDARIGGRSLVGWVCIGGRP